MADAETAARLRALPAISSLLETPAVRALIDLHGRPAVVEAAREAVAGARERIVRGERASTGPDEVAARLAARVKPKLRRVINATGVVLHTNLGRAPIATEALAHAVEAARGYANLELELETGRRGGRDAAVSSHLAALVGAEAGLAVNNCAAAALLALAAVARGGGVVVSRGELVEIGGGFRVPEVLAQSGARLVEVGTTNRTRLADYESAIDGAAAAILKVHRSNFAIVGFVEEASIAELSALARARGLPVLYDEGSGDLERARGAIADGADLVMFSGDKLLGGPQAGLIAGREALVRQVAKHPLARALRLDRMRLAALEMTLALWRAGRADRVPVARMLGEPTTEVRARAERLATLISGLPSEVVDSVSLAGGGTRPGETMASAAVRITTERAGDLAARLRSGEPALVARVEDGALWLDARTLFDDDLMPAAAALRAAWDGLGSDRTGTREALPDAGVFQEDAGDD